jgi:hypothetical protein
MRVWSCIDGKWGFVKNRKRAKYVRKDPERDTLFDLGLAISGATLQPGEMRTQQEIAWFVEAAGAHCTRQRIQQVEEKALRKVRAALYRDKDLRKQLHGTLYFRG